MEETIWIGLPASAALIISEIQADLVVTPVLVDQEVVIKEYPGATYWEGSNTVAGTFDGESASGGAYVEIAGHVPPVSDTKTDPMKVRKMAGRKPQGRRLPKDKFVNEAIGGIYMMSTENLFEVIILDIDGGVASQKRLLSQYDATVIPLREKVADLFAWCHKKEMDELRRLVEASCRTTKPKAIFFGAAIYHHLVYIGISMIKEPVTVICFDNHSEFWREKFTKFLTEGSWGQTEEYFNCGSWVMPALRLPNIKKIVLFGVDGDFGINKFMFYPKGMWSHAFDLLLNGTVEIYTNKMRQSVQLGRISGSLPCVEFKPGIFTTKAIWKNMSDHGGVKATVERVLSEIPTESVYITIDKDVLSEKESFSAGPGFTGEMTLDELLSALSSISKTKRVLGVDICRDGPTYDAVTDIQKSNASFIKKYMARHEYNKVPKEEFLSSANIRLNESVNLKIMEQLCQLS